MKTTVNYRELVLRVPNAGKKRHHYSNDDIIDSGIILYV